MEYLLWSFGGVSRDWGDRQWQNPKLRDGSNLWIPEPGAHSEFFIWEGGGGRADLEAIFNLFDFKNYILNIML